MEQDRFDLLAKAVAQRTNRRRLVRGIFGLGIGTAAVSVGLSPAEAARRGYAGPKFPLRPPLLGCSDEGRECNDARDCCSGCCIVAEGNPPECANREMCK